MTSYASSTADLEGARVSRANRRTTLAGLPQFFRIACNIALNLKSGTLNLILPDGRCLTFVGDDRQEVSAEIFVRDFAFARRTILGGDIGFFESFADGQWETHDLTGVLYLFALNADHIRTAFEAAPALVWLNGVRHALNRNTRYGARRNIMAHYDLGNAFYEKWLDRSMTYSSALGVAESADLADAQMRKYRTLAREMSLAPDDRVLEIGCGWGGFAEFAAKEVGARVTGLTISRAQYEYARERIHREGLSEKVDLRLQDYRDVSGAYDKIASIEMFEAVGSAYWPAYFAKIRDCLKPGGVAGLQVITIADRFFDHYRKHPDFIQRYVFPGGMLPSLTALRRQTSDASLTWRSVRTFGEDYALTLAAWRQRFLDAWDEIASLGFDDQFQRLWRYYLAYCEAGFRARTTDVIQLTLSR